MLLCAINVFTRNQGCCWLASALRERVVRVARSAGGVLNSSPTRPPGYGGSVEKALKLNRAELDSFVDSRGLAMSEAL